MLKKLFGKAAAAGLFAAMVFPVAASAAPTTVVVTPANTQGWTTDDTRPGGNVNYVADSTAPAGTAALQLLTDSTTTSKAQYMHTANTPLSQLTELSYYTKQNSASFPQGDPSYQLPVCLGGVTGTTCNGFTTLVFEPYENTDQGVVTPGVWQHWDVDAGQFWSSRTATGGGTCNVVSGAGGAPFYTLAALKTVCPNAVAVGFGVNVGSNNPSYNVETDLVSFNSTAYNFELTNVPTNKDQCKNGGYANYTDANGNAFPNQGQCVSFVNANSKGNATTVKNKNTVTVTNSSSQSSSTGNAKVKGNTTGGNATSGNASNSNSSSFTFTLSNNPTF